MLRLEDAIRKTTSPPANTFHFQGRGELREGNWADIVVFDPGKGQDNATPIRTRTITPPASPTCW